MTDVAVDNRVFRFDPQKDITTYELAECMGFLFLALLCRIGVESDASRELSATIDGNMSVRRHFTFIGGLEQNDR